MFVTGFSLSGQGFSDLLQKPEKKCQLAAPQCALYFIDYYQHNHLDSAMMVIEYWESSCGRHEPSERAKLLLDLKNGKIKDENLSPDIIRFFHDFKYRKFLLETGWANAFDEYPEFFSFIRPGGDFDKFTEMEMYRLSQQYQLSSLEFLVCEFYSLSTDQLMIAMQSDQFKETKMGRYYHHTVQNYLNMTEVHVGIITGIWIPRGDIEVLGNHLDIGIQGGIKYKYMNLDFVMTFRPGKAKESYLATKVHSTGALVETDHYFGGHLGVQYGQDLFIWKGNEMQLLAGIALDGFDAIEGNASGSRGESILQFDFNFGLRYRFYVTHEFYLGLEAKYHLVDYSRSDIIDFGGTPFTLGFVLGGVYSQGSRNDMLKAYQYPLRR